MRRAERWPSVKSAAKRREKGGKISAVQRFVEKMRHSGRRGRKFAGRCAREMAAPGGLKQKKKRFADGKPLKNQKNMQKKRKTLDKRFLAMVQ